MDQRVIAANTNNADFFISIHHNTTPGRDGTEVYAMNGGRGEEVANIILPEIVKLGFKDRGVKDGSGLFVINRTVMPAILIECAFCDSPKDMGNYDTDKMAEAIFNGICKAFEVKVSRKTQPPLIKYKWVCQPHILRRRSIQLDNNSLAHSGVELIEANACVDHIYASKYTTQIKCVTVYGISKR